MVDSPGGFHDKSLAGRDQCEEIGEDDLPLKVDIGWFMIAFKEVRR